MTYVTPRMTLPNGSELKNRIEKSLALHLSLASKELFHSNVLAYALKQWPWLLDSIFGVRWNSNYTLSLAREKSLGTGIGVVDLCVCVGGAEMTRLVIEIKLKSTQPLHN